MFRPLGNRLLSAALGAMILLVPHLAAQQVERITIDAKAPATPFPHFWEQMFGSDRAIVTLRESYRNDVTAVKAVTDFRYVRFHAIFHDETGVYSEDQDGKPIYNWATIDEVYDGLLKRGVRPLVELSFMPRKLAFNPDALHAFWYKQDVSGPKSYERWDDFIRHFTQHLVDRYGLDEVAQWYFEVWNEPNIDFWIGVPQQESYFGLYEHTVRDVKSVSPRLRVGGPATAGAQWIPEFLTFVAKNHVPIDFVSTHGYADDTEKFMLASDKTVPMDERVCAAVTKVHREIKASPFPSLPLFWTEWNVQGMSLSRDTIFVGPGLANTIRQCDGLVDQMSFWTFSDVFEEGGPIPRPFVGAFGLRARGGINKPSFYDFALLHQLGNERIASSSKNLIATRNADGSLAIAAWNIQDPKPIAWPPKESDPAWLHLRDGLDGPTQTMELTLQHVSPNATVTIQRVDETHGNVLPFFRKMGSPDSPTESQSRQLNQQSNPGPSETIQLRNGKLTITLTPNALLLVTLRP